VLLPLGLAAAGFLFGVLRSYASYRGKHLGGVLELGGPIIAAAMVVIGGFVLVPSPATFPITVYVHGERGPQDVVLRIPAASSWISASSIAPSQSVVMARHISRRSRRTSGDKKYSLGSNRRTSIRWAALRSGGSKAPAST
jgi:hypothetical protein